MNKKEKILICGILPPPYFGHSKMYEMLMRSDFVKEFDIIFLNMRFWSYGKHKRVSVDKLIKLIYYYSKFVTLLILKRPRYMLYNMSFDKMPFLKDFLFCFTGKLFCCRFIIHDMGQYVRELYDLSNNAYRHLIRWLLRNATASIVLGEVTKATYQGFMDKDRLLVVPGSVEDTASIFTGNGGALKDKAKINILYFSYMSKSKGVLTAFDAAKKVLDQSYDIQFTFAGPIESDVIRHALNELIKNYAPRIEYLGYIDDIKERTRVFRCADIFLFPTLRDVFGLVLLHAMAEGLPVVASIEGAIPEIIKDGQGGFLFKKGDSEILAEKILFLSNDFNLRESMGERNRKRYLDIYTPERYGKRMISAFEKVMQLS